MRYLFLIFLIFFLASSSNVFGQYIYPNDTTISNIHGVPKDSLTFYLPQNINTGKKNIQTGIDTYSLKWYSSDLYCAHEPVLYNFYLGHDLFRFLWLPTFGKPMIFTLWKENGKVWLTTKELDRQPQFVDINYPKRILSKQRKKDDSDINVIFDSVVLANRTARVILDHTKKLTINDWEEFQSLLNKADFWATKPYGGPRGLDGGEWIIEGQLKNKYWFVNRWSPTGALEKMGEFLIKKSGWKGTVY